MPSSFKRALSKSVPVSALFFGILLIFAGCDRQAKRFANAKETAKAAYESGSYPVVISTLEPYIATFPEDLEIKTLVGLSKVRSNAPFEGALLLQQAFRADPTLIHFGKEAAQAFRRTGDRDSAIETYFDYLEIFNDDAQAKLSLARLLLAENRQRETLELMLEAEKSAPQAIQPADSLTLGELFMRQGNRPQARRYFSRVESSEDFSIALPAQLNLIRIASDEVNWAEVETRITALDANLPGAFDSSNLAPLRQQLEERKAALLAMEEERRRQEEATALAQAELEAQATEPAEPEPTQESQTLQATTPNEIDSTDLEPSNATEMSTVEQTQSSEPEENSIEPDMSVANQPEVAAMPSDAELAAMEFPTFNPDESSSDTTTDSSETNPSPQPDRNSFEDAIVRGDAALAAGDPEGAIEAYYDAQAFQPESPVVWEKLSAAFQAQDAPRNAEIALLEAMRHAPLDEALRIRYLRFVQTLGDPAKLMRAIQEAKQRFTENADITLLLARAYERIEQNDRIARFYYNQFLQLAPEDPQAPAVRERLLGR